MEIINEKEIEFTLVDEQIFEDAAIWPQYNKRNDKLKDKNGNELSFPIKSGMIIDADGKERDFDSVISMPPFIFKKLFPDLAKQISFVRQIYIAGTECYYAFRKTANQAINTLIKTIKIQGGDPLQMIFKQTYDEKAPPQSKYAIEVIGKIGGIEQQQTEKPKINIDVQTPEKTDELQSNEKAVLDAISELPNKINKEQFEKVCKDNDISEDRVDLLFSKY